MEGPNNQSGNVMGKADFAAHTHSNQAIAGGSALRGRAKVSKVMGSEMIAVHKYVTKAVQRVFDDVYAPDMNVLFGVVLYLAITGKVTTNKDDVIRWMGYRIKPAMTKAMRRLERLADGGYLLRVRYNMGALDRRGYGFAVSERGKALADMFNVEYEKAKQWVKRQRRLEANILYLDQAAKMLKKSQEIIMTPDLVERLKSIKV